MDLYHPTVALARHSDDALHDGSAVPSPICAVYAAQGDRDPLVEQLTLAGIRVLATRDRDLLRRLLATGLADVALVKVRSSDGAAIVRWVRSTEHRVPLLAVLEGNGGSTTDALAVAGADDVARSVDPASSLARRVHALRDGARPSPRAVRPAAVDERITTPTSLRIGCLEVDFRTLQAWRAGAPAHLRPLEYRLLAALLQRDGAPATRAELLQEVWKLPPDVRTRTVDTHVLTLRAKLEPDRHRPRHLLKVPRIGYRLVR